MTDRNPKQELINRLPSPFRTASIYREVVTLNIEEYFTFADLQVLSKLFGTTLINVISCIQGYYGDHESSRVEVTCTPETLNKWYHTVEETRELDRERDKKERARWPAPRPRTGPKDA